MDILFENKRKKKEKEKRKEKDKKRERKMCREQLYVSTSF